MNETLIFVYGIILGAWLVEILHTYWARRDERRAREARAAALHRAAGDLYFSSFRAHRLEQRMETRR